MNPSETYWFERKGVIWSGTYPNIQLKPKIKTNIRADLDEMLNQAKLSSYVTCSSYKECPEFINKKLDSVRRLGRLLSTSTFRIPYLSGGLAPIQVFIYNPNYEGSWHLLMYRQPKNDSCTTLFEYVLDTTSAYINYDEVILNLGEHMSKSIYSLESYLNNKLHGNVAQLNHSPSGDISSYNNGKMHGIHQKWSREEDGWDSPKYFFHGLEHGLSVCGYEIREYFFGKLLMVRKMCGRTSEEITIYNQNGNIAKTYQIDRTGIPCQWEQEQREYNSVPGISQMDYKRMADFDFIIPVSLI